MPFKSLLVRRLETSGSLSWRDIEDLKYIYMNHICQPISQGVQKLTFLLHHRRVNKLHHLLRPMSTCPLSAVCFLALLLKDPCQTRS